MMDTPDRTNTVLYATSAAIISLLAHLLLVGMAGRIPVRLFAGAVEDEPRPDSYRSVIRIFEKPDIEIPDGDGEDLKTDEGLEPLDGEELVRKYFEEIDLIVPPKPSLELKGLGSNVVLPTPPAPELPAAPTAPRPDILAMSDDGLSADALMRRMQIPDVPRVTNAAPHLPSLVADGPLVDGALPPLQVGMRLSKPRTDPHGIVLPPLPKSGNGRPAAEEELPPPNSLNPEIPLPGPEESFESMDALLDVQLYTYMPAQGAGYLRIDVSPNTRSSRLRAMPKDVLILIDCSTSISPGKLKVFKESADYALDFLNLRDRFNVVSFRTQPEPLFSNYQPVNRENIAKAQKYVREMVRGGMTDVYAGLAPFLQRRPDGARNPLLVYILTDGKSTVRNKLDNDEFIRRVAEINTADVTVYSASAGKGANRFLLDLLSYSNRGLPLHREEYTGYDRVLAQFMGQHNDIIVADLQYDLSGSLEREVYPRRLPHLYRGETLSIYARYPRGLKNIGLRLTGISAEGGTKELMYMGDLAQAKKATPDLAYDWIGQKVFSLVISNVLSPREQYAREIRRLKDKYDLQIPYF